MIRLRKIATIYGWHWPSFLPTRLLGLHTQAMGQLYLWKICPAEIQRGIRWRSHDHRWLSSVRFYSAGSQIQAFSIRRSCCRTARI